MNVGNTIGAGTKGAANAQSQGIQSLTSSAGQAAMMPYFAQMSHGQAGQTPQSYGMASPAFNSQAGGPSSYNLLGGQYVPTY